MSRKPQGSDQLQRPRTGFFLVPDALLDQGLATHELAVLVAIWRHADRQLTAFPSHGLLARETGMSARRVRTAIVQLVKKHLLRLDSGKAAGRSNLYTLVVPPRTHRQKGRDRHGVPTSSARDADPLGTLFLPGRHVVPTEGYSVKVTQLRNTQGRDAQYQPPHFSFSNKLEKLRTAIKQMHTEGVDLSEERTFAELVRSAKKYGLGERDVRTIVQEISR